MAAEHVAEQQREQDEEASWPLREAVRVWHDAEHVEAWAVCPHPVCREAERQWGDPWPRGLTLLDLPRVTIPIRTTVYLPGDAPSEASSR